MERLTTRHSGVAVIKDKTKLKIAMERLAKIEESNFLFCEECEHCETGNDFGIECRRCRISGGLNGNLEKGCGCTRGTRKENK